MIIIVLGIAVSMSLFGYIRTIEHGQTEYSLKLAADERFHAIHAEGNLITSFLQGFEGFFTSSDVVNADEFSRYARKTALTLPYIKAAYWLPKHNGNPPFYSVEFAEPESSRDALPSIEINTDPQLAQRMQQAFASNRLLVIPWQHPADNSQQPLYVALPIHPTSRHQAEGFVILWLDFDNFIHAAMEQPAAVSHKLDIYIVGGATSNQKQLVLYHPADSHEPTRIPEQPPGLDSAFHQILPILGQNWMLYIKPISDSYAGGMSAIPWFVLVTSLVITFLIAGVINANTNRRSYAESLVFERTRALRNSEKRLAQLYNIISSERHFSEKTRALLAYGCRQLGLQYGILSQVVQDTYTIKYAWSEDDSLEEGAQFELGDTYCRQTLHNNGITSVENAGKSEWTRHPCYEIFKLEAYIGTPIYVNNRLYGTLNFSSAAERETRFTRAEEELVQLMAQWLGMELAHIHFQEQIVEQKNTISHILENTAEAFLAVDYDLTVLYANSLTQSMLNLNTKRLAGRSLMVVAPELQRMLGDALQDTLNNKSPIQLDCYHSPNDKWLEVAVHPTLQGASITVRDITEARRNAEQLAHTLAMRNSILNSANFSIIATDVDGTIISFNRAAERMLGYRADEVIGKCTPLIFHDPEELALVADDLQDETGIEVTPDFRLAIALARRRMPEREWTYIRKDGSRFPVLISVTEMTDDQGASIGILGMGLDITERKHIERMRDEFISTVSHELRTPLTSIRGSLGLLIGNVFGQMPEQAKSLVEIAGRNADRLLHLINDILDVNKIESGKMTFNFEPVQLSDLLQQAIEQNQSYGEQFRVKLQLTGSIPRVSIYADMHRLMQVMSNLLSNAVKFSAEDSEVNIDANTFNNFVRISVTDHGQGIAPEFRQKVFEKFTQADASDSRHTGGTGLGLNIARAIVEQHGGKLDYVSQPGIGSSFYFDLPIHDQTAITRIKDQILSQSMPRPHRLLICEDDHDVAGLLQLMLARHGYQSEIVHTADQAREVLEYHNYDAMLLDLLLPDMHGLTLVRQLRQSPQTRQLPVIVISAIADTARKQLEGGVTDIIDWLDKPVDQEHLLQAVNRALQGVTDKPRILHIADDATLQQTIRQALSDQQEMHFATTLEQARELLNREQYDLVMLDAELDEGTGLELLDSINAQDRPPATLVFSNCVLDEKYFKQVTATLRKSTLSEQQLMDTIENCMQPPEQEILSPKVQES